MRRLLIAMMLTLLAGCAQQQQPPRDDSLYHDLGQRAGIQRIVEGMLINVAKDQRIVEHFKKVDIVRLRDKLVEQLCVESGGPCHYSGDSMAEAHKGQNLTPAISTRWSKTSSPRWTPKRSRSPYKTASSPAWHRCVAK